VQKGRAFTILFGREDEMITELSEKYKDVTAAEKLALFGENNQLQIAMNKGEASKLLGLKLHEIVRIEFK
jgi:S-adenosylmethionine hydrolase